MITVHDVVMGALLGFSIILFIGFFYVVSWINTPVRSKRKILTEYRQYNPCECWRKVK